MYDIHHYNHHLLNDNHNYDNYHHHHDGVLDDDKYHNYDYHFKVDDYYVVYHTSWK